MKLESHMIDDPFPVWKHIKNRLSDDTGALANDGLFLGVFDIENENKMVGAFQIILWSEHCYQIHGGILPEYYGHGVEICLHMGKSLFYGSPCLKIVAIIPEFNKLMINCLKKIGMKQEGIITKSFKKWMKLHDQIIFGMTKMEVRLCHQ